LNKKWFSLILILIGSFVVVWLIGTSLYNNEKEKMAIAESDFKEFITTLDLPQKTFLGPKIKIRNKDYWVFEWNTVIDQGETVYVYVNVPTWGIGSYPSSNAGETMLAKLRKKYR
jgi:hypothetical protein